MQRILPVLALLCFSIASQGAMYKWVDENGVTQFSQFPPTRQEAEQVRDTAPPPSEDPEAVRERLERQLEGLNERQQAREEARQQQVQDREAKALRRRNCETARHNLGVVERSNRIRVETAPGEYTYLNDDERLQRLENARQRVREFCD